MQKNMLPIVGVRLRAIQNLALLKATVIQMGHLFTQGLDQNLFGLKELMALITGII